MDYALISVTPGANPVTLAQAKKQCEVDFPDNDAFIEDLMAVALARFDGQDGLLGRALLAQQWKYRAPGFDNAVPPDGNTAARYWTPGELLLPLPPLISVDSVQYVDTHGDAQSLDVTQWRVIHRGTRRSSIVPAPGSSWPAVSTSAQAVTITFTAGYSAVPAAIVQAMRLFIGHLYINREAVVAPLGNNPSELPMGVSDLIAPYQIPPFTTV